MALRRRSASGSFQTATYRSANSFGSFTAPPSIVVGFAPSLRFRRCPQPCGQAIPCGEWQLGAGAPDTGCVTSGTRCGGFADALREWRQRRRVSQLELALRAGTTQRHVSFVESGRSVPGRAMVVRLAESLEVPLRERNALLLAAGYAPAYQETRFDDPRLGPVRAALERVLEGHHPYPAVIVDRHGDLVSANRAFGVLTDGVAPGLLEPPVNLPRVLLDPDGMAARIVNLDEWAWHVIDALHREAARNPNDRLEALVSELKELVPDRPRQPGPDYLGFAVPLRLRSSDGELRLLTTLAHFGTAVDVTVAELRLEAFLPADEATASALTKLGRATPPTHP
ncbi:MAG: helix-turn-helix domain-containing protein [Streptosporangiales bacterium]|nr:helix-turn-helix domain-containing protein [Streptosporangiales bacterium]